MERQRECDYCDSDAEYQKEGKDFCGDCAVQELDLHDLLLKAGFSEI